MTYSKAIAQKIEEKATNDADIPQKHWDMYMYHKYGDEYPIVRDEQKISGIRCNAAGKRTAYIQPYSIVHQQLMYIIEGGQDSGGSSGFEQNLRKALKSYPVVETQTGIFMFPALILEELHTILRVGKKSGGIGWHTHE